MPTETVHVTNGPSTGRSDGQEWRWTPHEWGLRTEDGSKTPLPQAFNATETKLLSVSLGFMDDSNPFTCQFGRLTALVAIVAHSFTSPFLFVLTNRLQRGHPNTHP